MDAVRQGSRNILETIIDASFKLFLTCIQAGSAIFHLIFKKNKKMLEDFKKIKDLVKLAYRNENQKAITVQLQQLDILVYQFYNDYDNVDLNIYLRNIRLITSTITETTSKNVRLFKLNEILQQLEQIEILIPTLKNVYNKITSSPKDNAQNIGLGMKEYDYYDDDEDRPSPPPSRKRRHNRNVKKEGDYQKKSIENQIVWLI